MLKMFSSWPHNYAVPCHFQRGDHFGYNYTFESFTCKASIAGNMEFKAQVSIAIYS